MKPERTPVKNRLQVATAYVAHHALVGFAGNDEDAYVSAAPSKRVAERRWSLSTWMMLVAILFCVVMVVRNLLEVYGPNYVRAAISCGRPDVELERPSTGSIAEGFFMIESVGGRPLIISAVKSGCGCAKIGTTAFPKTLEPGEALPLKVSMDLAHKSEKITATVLVFSNDAANPVLRLRVEGAREELTLAEPKRL